MGDNDKPTECGDLFNLHCKQEFRKVQQTLDSVKTVLCGDVLLGRIGMDERIRRLEEGKQSRADNFGPFVAAIIKNWKTLSIIAAVFLGMWANVKSGKPMTVEEIKQVIKQVQESEVGSKTIGTAPVKKMEQEYQVN
jgi:hypothetical protein